MGQNDDTIETLKGIAPDNAKGDGRGRQELISDSELGDGRGNDGRLWRRGVG